MASRLGLHIDDAADVLALQSDLEGTARVGFQLREGELDQIVCRRVGLTEQRQLDLGQTSNAAGEQPRRLGIGNRHGLRVTAVPTTTGGELVLQIEHKFQSADGERTRITEPFPAAGIFAITRRPKVDAHPLDGRVGADGTEDSP